MHANALLLTKLYSSLDGGDYKGMAECYHADATFEDIAFSLCGKQQIQAMWHMIADGAKLRATFKVLHADDQSGSVDLIDDYTFKDTGRPVHNVIRSDFRFRDGLIIEHRDSCSALKWGMQALGPVKGVIAWLVPSTRRNKAKSKLEAFIATHSG